MCARVYLCVLKMGACIPNLTGPFGHATYGSFTSHFVGIVFA